jgi:hypothetical protein
MDRVGAAVFFNEGAMQKPESLTVEKAMSCLPKMTTNKEWERKHDAGELPEGVMGLCGMVDTIWPDEKLTRQEAEYVLWIAPQMSMRCLAATICGDSNQLFGMWIIEAATDAIGSSPKNAAT